MQCITEDFACRAVGGLYFRVYIVWQAHRPHEVVDLIAGKSVVDTIIKDDFNNRKAKHGGAPYASSLLDWTHAQFDWCRYEAFDFLRTPSVPLSNDGYLCIGHIGKCLNGHAFKANETSNSQNTDPNKGKRFIFNGKGDDIFNEFVHSCKC